MNDRIKKGERIAKRIARAGLCSRRDAEKLIEMGRVSVNGAILSTPAHQVVADDAIRVDGDLLPEKAPTRLWRYHKPAGLVTTHRDPQGRPTLFETLPASTPRVISVGRLDLTSEGLLLLTNDGELARRLELPSSGWVRRYRVRVHGEVAETSLAALAQGITVEGVRYGPVKAVLEKRQGASNAWIRVELAEGKNREIRRILAHLGYQVTRLIRLAYGPFELGALPEGALEEVPPHALPGRLKCANPGDRKANPEDEKSKMGQKSWKKADARRSATRRTSRTPRPAEP